MAGNGFAALADLDSNQDHVFDNQDDLFNEVRVWGISTETVSPPQTNCLH